MAVKYGSLPFREQIAFFLGKLNVPTRAWTDIWRDAHDTSFMVAGAYKADLIADFREAVRKGIEDGTTIQTFRKDFDTIVAKHGWSYKGARGWRTRVIYETNIRTSYQAGRYAQLTDPDLLQSRPFWRYKHSDSVRFPRPQHLAWDDLVLRHDDPWWQAHFPPNGWGCKCTVYAESDRTLRKLGKPGPDSAPPVEYETKTVGTRGPSPRTVSVPKGIDPGWDYAPGRTVAERVREQIRQRTLAAWPRRPARESALRAAASPATTAMKLKPHQRVSAELAETRAVSCLTRTPVPASYVADHIWPDNNMKAQGAGGSASRILKRLEKKGLARWTGHAPGGWGWINGRRIRRG